MHRFLKAYKGRTGRGKKVGDRTNVVFSYKDIDIVLEHLHKFDVTSKRRFEFLFEVYVRNRLIQRAQLFFFKKK